MNAARTTPPREPAFTPEHREALAEAVKPWSDHNGPLPDYDHPAACVFDSGVQHAVELLAKELCVTDWTPCDGTEEYDGDLGGTLKNIVLAAMPKDEHGDPVYPKDVAALFDTLTARIAVLEAIINTPETDNFVAALPREAEHQRERWGADHDVGKQPLDWFWLIGYLAQKAANAAMRGDTKKAKHHTISTAAALANWHDALSGGSNRMRPGIDSAALAPIA